MSKQSFVFSEPRIKTCSLKDFNMYLDMCKDTCEEFNMEYPPVILDMSVHGELVTFAIAYRFEVK